MESVTATGLPNPSGVITRFGVLPAGSVTEVPILAAGVVTVPTTPPDEHHLTDFHAGVAKGASGTIFRIYYKPVVASSFIQVEEIPMTDYGSHVITLGSSHRFKAGEQWKVTVQQSVAGRVSLLVLGQAKFADSRD